MDIGLYNLKYAARNWIRGVLPLFRDTDPNTISLWLLPVGLAMAACYVWATRGWTGLYFVAIAMAFVRMFLGTLDGLVAVQFGKSTPRGELVNRITPEICDALYLTAIALVQPDRTLGALALGVAWLTSFSGLLGATIGQPTQSVGPVGQTDRLVALQLFSLLQFLSHSAGWGVDFLRLFLGWVVVGGTLTIFLRLRRHLRAARQVTTSGATVAAR